MTEELKRRLPLVPGPTAAAKEEAINLEDRPRGNGPAHISVTHPPLLAERAPIGNIAKAIAGVMREVGTVEKRGMNKFHNYPYMTIGDMLHAITPLMGKHGLAVIMNEVERVVVESRVAVTYEFSIIHESGEVWPERPRQTGMAIARDSKGNWDDKAINKCHTAARKYFLLGLFQVPAGDFDDADADKGTGPSPPPVPGPSAPAVDQGDKQARAVQWADDFIEQIRQAANKEELVGLEHKYDRYLQTMSEKYPEIYGRISGAMYKRLNDPTVMMPADTQEAMNWVAQQLNSFATYEAAEKFWNDIVEPSRSRFDVVDWEMLLAEWQRNELRLADGGNDPNDGNQQHVG